MAGLRGLFRPLLFVLWGLGVMSAVFIFSLVSFVAPPLDVLLAHPTAPLGMAASLVFPFSAGLMAASAAGESFSVPSLVLGATGVLLAVVGAIAATFGASRIVNEVVLPGRQGGGARRAASYSLSLRGPLSAYILKDLRVSSRNPATGFLFALPVFEVVAVVVPLTATAVVRMSALIVGTEVGGGFALFIAFLLVTVEDLGVERRTALPLSEAVRTLSKVAISTSTYLPVPLALAVILSTKASTFPGGAAIPIAAVGSVFAACVVEVIVLKILTERGQGAAVRFAAGVGSGEVVLILPAAIYAVEYVLSRSHTLSFELLLITTLAEILAAAGMLRLVGGPSGRGSAASKAGLRGVGSD
jgi:predicted permease